MTARQTVIVTGGNSGLGFEAAQALAESDQGWHVVIACRNAAKAASAVRTITNRTAKCPVEATLLELASLASIRAFAQEYATRNRPPLRGVVLNAGSQFVKGTTYTQDGFEATFGINHLGHFLLANLLLPQMSATARIAFVSSGTHDPDQWSGMPAPQLQDASWLAHPMEDGAVTDSIQKLGQRRYTTSKLCNVLCAYELAPPTGQRTGCYGQRVRSWPDAGVRVSQGLWPGIPIRVELRPSRLAAGYEKRELHTVVREKPRPPHPRSRIGRCHRQILRGYNRDTIIERILRCGEK